MKKTNKLLITAIVASSILGTAYASAHRIYDDVPTNHWAYEAVRVLSEKGLLQGLPNGSFKGDKPLTRYSFAVVVSRMLDRYNELISNNNQVNEKDIKALENLVTEFINEIESLSEEVKELKSDVKTVQSSLTDAKSNISQLNTKTTNLETCAVPATSDESGIRQYYTGYPQHYPDEAALPHMAACHRQDFPVPLALTVRTAGYPRHVRPFPPLAYSPQRKSPSQNYEFRPSLN